MSTAPPTTVRMLAFLHTYCREHGLPTAVDVSLPETGMTAGQLAHTLELPLEMIEGLFLNARLVGTDATVRPGDRVAFLPYGTPATHPAFFGKPA